MVPSANDQSAPIGHDQERSRLVTLERLQRVLATRFGDARLTVELVPKTSWYSNVRSHIAPVDWDRLRRPVFTRARSRCEICSGRGAVHPVECHEVWQYDDAARVQRLMALVALCPACHGVKHFGRSYVKGRIDEAVAHLMALNGWSRDNAKAYVDVVIAIWELRSLVPWRLDLTWLAEQGISTAEDTAERRLQE